jgi:hypothetical protein
MVASSRHGKAETGLRPRSHQSGVGSVETLAITRTALADALALGFNRPGIVLVIQGVRRSMFVKSMTTHADHRVWQDVYHVPADITFPPMACGCTSNSKPTS